MSSEPKILEVNSSQALPDQCCPKKIYKGRGGDLTYTRGLPVAQKLVAMATKTRRQPRTQSESRSDILWLWQLSQAD